MPCQHHKQDNQPEKVPMSLEAEAVRMQASDALLR